MNRVSRRGVIASEAPTGRRRIPQASWWKWRRQAATVLLFVYGFLPLLPGHALAALPLLGRPSRTEVASLRVTPRATLIGPASYEMSLGISQLAALPRQGDTLNLITPSILPPPASATVPSHVTALGRLPLAFIENKGQVDERVRFYVRSGHQTVWLTPEGLRFDLLRTKGGAETRPATPPLEAPHHPMPASPPRPPERERLVFAQDFLNTARQPTIEARNPLPGIYNFFLGNDPAKWRTEVKGYGELIYRDVWAGIDLKLYGNGRALEQEFIVRPGGDLSRIKVAYRGIDRLTVAKDGSLLIATAFGTLKESPPRIYQEINGQRVEVAGRFKLLTPQSEIPNPQFAYTFEVGPHHPQYALVIDPTLAYSTYLGGGSYEWGRDIAVDAAGNAYVTGLTGSSDFPTTSGAFQSTLGGASDAFVTKLNATGSALLYSTFLGGSTTTDDGGFGIVVDAAGNACVTGYTYSSDFPTTPGAFQTARRGPGDAFVTKLNATGSALVYSTFLGGSAWEVGYDIAVDAAGNAYVTGETSSSLDFPTTPGAVQGTYGGITDAFVMKLNPTGSALVYSTFLGGSGQDDHFRGHGIAVDAAGNAYVTGLTGSSDFPTTSGAFQSTLGGASDAFVTKLNATGSALLYSTFLGGSGQDHGHRIAVDAAGYASVTGVTYSSDFPTTSGAFQSTLGGASDAFVTKLNATGSALLYSTFLGGSGQDHGQGIAVDAAGYASVTGTTGSSDFPTTSGAFQSTGGSNDVFVTKLNATGSALLYSTFLGGSGDEDFWRSIAVDAAGNAYVTGMTWSSDFPTTPGAFQGTYGHNGDAFVAKFDFGSQKDIMTAAKTYGGPNREWADAIRQTTDGGYIMAGGTTSFGAGGEDVWIVKLDSAGVVQWQKTYGGTGAEDDANAIQQTADGGYIVAGDATSFGTGLTDFWILKLDSAGTVQWQKTYGGAGDDDANAIQQTTDGGYIVVGSTESFGAGNDDIWLLKLDSAGTVQWQKTYGGAGEDEASAIQQTSDGGYIVVGDTSGAGNDDFWILKLDSAGTVQWQKTYGGVDDDEPGAIQQTTDGGYIVAGSTESFGAGGEDAWVLKLDSAGAVQWQKTYGGAGDDEVSAIQQTTDGGYIVVGETETFGAGGSDAWVLKLDSSGNITPCAAQGTSTATVTTTSVTGANTTVAGVTTTVTASATSVTPQNSTASTTAVCPASGTFTLTVTTAGTGSGTVTSNPPVISCGNTCSASVTPGTLISLTATPAFGSTFTGWSGACTGTGACSVTLDAAKSVTATFTLTTSVGPSITLHVTGSGPGPDLQNPITISYTIQGCSGREMFLVLNAPAMGIPWSYLSLPGWIPLPATLASITPYASGPPDGTYTLYTGTVPSGSYGLHLGCDVVPDGHLTLGSGLTVNGVYDYVSITVP